MHYPFTFIGRIKELIVTAGGENIAPVPIESYLKNKLGDAISNVVLIGDKRKYLTILITLKVKQNLETTEFTNELVGDALEISQQSFTVDDARNDPIWKNYIQNAINIYNKDKTACVSNAQTIKYFRILDRDFSEVSGELTSTMKLKRSVIHEKFAIEINSMYQK